MCVCKRREGNEVEGIEYWRMLIKKMKKFVRGEIKNEYGSIKSIIFCQFHVKIPCLVQFHEHVNFWILQNR